MLVTKLSECADEHKGNPCGKKQKLLAEGSKKQSPNGATCKRQNAGFYMNVPEMGLLIFYAIKIRSVDEFIY